MTLNKFCPVAQGEYYNIKSPRKSQPLFPVFFKVFSFVCAISPTAASRRSLGRVSVPMWPVTLSGRLLIVALVGRYPANKLIRRGSISYHRSFSHCTMWYCALMRYYQPFPAAIPLYEAGYPRVTHPSATQS